MSKIEALIFCLGWAACAAGGPVWIGDEGNAAPAFEKSFAFGRPVASAELRISGLGFYEAYLNGRRIGDRELEPTPTDYTKRVYYSTYDLTREIAATNVIRVLLGNGWYNSAETGVWRFDKAPWRDFPRLWADLAVTFADGSRTNVVTDATWSVAPSPVLFNDFREGEIVRSESRPLPPLKEPRRVQVVSGPKGRLVPETHEPARVVERVRPVAIEKFENGWILDFGKNLAGRMRMNVRGAKEGDVVSFRYDERKPPAERHIDCYIQALPSTNAWNLADAGYQTDRFICNGDAVETYAPRFTYHGFRYVLVRGLRTAPAAEDATAEFIRTDYGMECSSLLVTSDETFNRLLRAAALAYDCNFTDGFPTDCPHREKNGWLADATITATFGLYRAGTENALRDWVRLIGESQRPNGSVPCIVPDYGWEYDGHSCCNSGPGWGTALTTLPTILCRIRGERDFLVEMYPAMRRYCECLWKDLKDGLIIDGNPDWMAPKLLEPDKCWTPRTPAKLTSTAYAYRSFLETAAAADLAGRPDDATELRRRADVVKAAFNREFHRGNGVYHEGWACGQAFALNFGLVDAKDVEGARRQLVKAVHAEDDHIDFGMLGASVVFRELSKAGETALAYKMIMNTAPSFADWVRSGDTTLREDFPGKLSRNHPSFGDFAAWAYEYVLGVRAAEPGYRKFVFDPRVRGLPLTHARAKVRLAKGFASVEASWRRDAALGEIACRLVVPHGTKAEVPRLGKSLGPGVHEFTLPPESDATARWISDCADGGVDVARPMVGVGVTEMLPKNVIALRKRFVLKGAPASARAKVTGLGFYRLVVNGADVDPTRLMMPGWTNPGWRVLYDEYDVARWLREGTNEVRILLAPGYSDDMNPWTWRWMRPKRAWMEMEVADGDVPRRIVTDGTWEFTDDLPFVSASIYHGETYDATRGGNARWRPVVELADDSLRLEPNEGPAIRLFDPIKPVKVIRCPHGRLILDFGVNRAGVVEMRAKLPRGARVVLRHAEEISGDRLDTWTQKEARQTDVFIAAGTGEVETYRPRFTYHGFRYVEVEGLPADQAKGENFTGWGVSADVREKATFRCSDETLNWLWDTARRSMRSNFVSYPSDCCIRHERTPCLMDSQAYEDTAFQVYDIRAFYSKWLYDAARYERAVDPKVGNNDNPDWAGDPITLSGRFLTYLAATNLAVREYAELKRAAESFAARSPDGLWEKGFGDWCSPAGWDFFDPGFVNSAFLVEAYRTMAHLAEVKGERADAARFADLRRKAHEAFLRRHYDPKSHVFGAGRQVCFILPLALGLVPEGDVPAVVANLRRRLVGTDGGHIGTGIYGTRYFGDVLMDHGLGDEWFTAMTRKDFPGFGFMRASGATSLWEQWARDGEMNSHNHAMFAGAVSCFLTHLAGIRPAADGYSRVLVKPCFPKGLDSVEATIELPCGHFAVSWKRRGKGVDYRLSAPEDVRIEFDLPQGCNLIREGVVAADTNGEWVCGYEVPRSAKAAVLVPHSVGRVQHPDWATLKPGETYIRCNPGWGMTYRMVAVGKPLNEVLRELVLIPAGIENDFEFASPESSFPRLAEFSYSGGFCEIMNNDWARKACLPSAWSVSSARGLAKFYNRLCGFDGEAPLLKKETLDEALKPCRWEDDPLPNAKRLNDKWYMLFGMGYGLWGEYGRMDRVFGHGGAGGSEALVDRDNRLIVAYTCNYGRNSIKLRTRLYSVVGMKWRYWKDEADIQTLQMRTAGR